jgi:hypothetical protein
VIFSLVLVKALGLTPRALTNTRENITVYPPHHQALFI